MRNLLKDYPSDKWIEATDRCEYCGSLYEVRIHKVDESGCFGWAEWRVGHKVDCPDVDEYVEDAPVTEISSMDSAGWEYMDKPFMFRGLELYPLKSRADVGPCLLCGKLIVGIPLILFIDEGKGGELDFCFPCAKEKGIMEGRIVMGTKESTLPEKAGVECPKETGSLDKDLSCRVCEHYSRCMRMLLDFYGEKTK